MAAMATATTTMTGKSPRLEARAGAKSGCRLCEEYRGREYNAETIAAMHEDLSGARAFNSVDELFADLMSDDVHD
jgi:hypothetical protein